VVLGSTPAGGARFVQPVLDDGRKLDDRVGGGWRLFVRSAALACPVADGRCTVVADLPDGGALTAWLDAHGVDAVLVRPDHYVFGTASGSAAPLLAARDAWLFNPMEIA
ncbi:monooxygenase, partial [Novosphingobium sp. 1949]|nr:monooxygenase [Novosphingobium organovorum]